VLAMDLSYDPDPPARKPRPIASSPFWTGTGSVPGMRAPDPAAVPGMSASAPQTPGMQIPTPMGWLSPDVPLSSANIRRLLDQSLPPGGLL
jgi:hypothetical protein